MARSAQPPGDATTIWNPPVVGALPPTLAGRYLGIDPSGCAHDVTFRAGRAVSYRTRSIRLESAASPTAVVAFAGSVFAFADGELAVELDRELRTIRRVDLAGAGRGVHACVAVDPFDGGLHLVADEADGTQVHVTVAANALTRSVRSIDGAPGRVTDLAVGEDHVVFRAGAFAGSGTRSGSTPVTWAAAPTGSCDDDGLIFVPDPDRVGDDDGGWLVGLVPGDASQARLVVLDAADHATVAAIRIPRPVPNGIHATWIPSSH